MMKTYSIKIALRGISPMIWRRLRLSGNTSLASTLFSDKELGSISEPFRERA